MIVVRRLLLMLIVVLSVACPVVVLLRAMNPLPPNPDLSDLDSITRADIEELRNQAMHGGLEEWRSLAQAFLGYGFYEEAQSCFRIAVKLAPYDQEAVYGLGFCLERMGFLDEAILWLENAAQLSNDDLKQTCGYQIGRCYLRLEQTAAAESVFAKVQSLPAAKYQLVKLLIRTNRLESVSEHLDQLEEQIPHSHKIAQLRAQLMELQGDTATAAIYRDRERRGPAGVNAEYGLSFIAMFRSQLGLDERMTECAMLEQGGSPENAARCLESMLKLIREEKLNQYENAFLKAAQLALAIQNPKQVLAYLDELTALEAERYVVLEMRGDAYAILEQFDLAKSAWLRSYTQRPTPQVANKLAKVFGFQGDSETAQRYLAQAHQLAGIAAYYENQILIAEQEIETALKLQPDDARSWYYLGEIKRLMNIEASSRSAYNRCLELDPNYTRADLGRSLLDNH